MKNHYVYNIIYNTGKHYIGVRSCKGPIEKDTYMGSAFHLPKDVIGCKEILSIHATREEAMQEEIKLHALYNVKDNPMFYNQCNATSTKFQVSEEAIKRGAEKRKGRTKETHEYIARQVASRAKYKGEGLTIAQKLQWTEDKLAIRKAKREATLKKTLEDPEKAKKIKEAQIRGGKSGKGIPNIKKAHFGLDHPRVQPWWYLHPEKGKIEVMDSVRGYHNNEEFPVSSASISRFLKLNKVPNYLIEQGWDFGLIHG